LSSSLPLSFVSLPLFLSPSLSFLSPPPPSPPTNSLGCLTSCSCCGPGRPTGCRRRRSSGPTPSWSASGALRCRRWTAGGATPSRWDPWRSWPGRGERGPPNTGWSTISQERALTPQSASSEMRRKPSSDVSVGFFSFVSARSLVKSLSESGPPKPRPPPQR